MKKQLIAAALAAMIAAGAAENIFATGEWKATAYPQNIPLAFDGKMDTRWVSYTGKNASATLTCTLPEPSQIQAVVLVGSNLAGGTVEITENGTAWNAAGELKSTCQEGMLSLCLAEPVAVKGVRLKLRGSADRNQPVNVQEMAAYVPDVPVSLATFCSIDESGAGTNWRFSPKFLVDGNSMSRGSHYSAYKGSVLTLDLGEAKEVSSVGFCCAAPVDKVTVSVSGDGENWTKAGEAEKLASDQMLEFPKQTARYLKIELQATYRSAPVELIVK